MDVPVLDQTKLYTIWYWNLRTKSFVEDIYMYAVDADHAMRIRASMIAHKHIHPNFVEVREASPEAILKHKVG